RPPVGLPAAADGGRLGLAGRLGGVVRVGAGLPGPLPPPPPLRRPGARGLAGGGPADGGADGARALPAGLAGAGAAAADGLGRPGPGPPALPRPAAGAARRRRPGL